MFDVFATLAKKAPADEIVTLSVRMPKQLRDDFTKLCEVHQVDVSEVVRALLKAQLDVAIQKDMAKDAAEKGPQ